jgi:hypothetical protein
MRYASESYCEREIWRRRELKWEYVDLDAGILNLPDSKSGAKTAYLGKPAIDTLRRLARLPRNPSICATRSQVVDDRCVLAGIGGALVDRLAAVKTVAEDLVDRAFVDRLARPALAVLGRPRLRRVASAAEFLRQLGRRPDRRN